MKTLQETQKENRKMILEAIHGCSYEEALEKEIGFGCEVYLSRLRAKDLIVAHKVIIITITKQTIECLKDDTVWLLDREFEDIKIEIIGKPLTLDRVLLALGKQKWWRFAYPLVLGFDGAFCEVWHSETDVHFSEKFNWDLTKQTLEEQSEETQRAIHILMGEQSKETQRAIHILMGGKND